MNNSNHNSETIFSLYQSYLKIIIPAIILSVIGVYLSKEYAVYFLLALNFILILSIVFLSTDINIVVILLAANFIPLGFLNNNFHYTLKWIIIQDIPLFFLFLISVSQYVLKEKKIELRYDGMFGPLIALTLYSFLSAFLGYLNKNNFTLIVDELYHFLYYSFAIVLFYLIKERRDYQKIFTVIIAISVLVSIQYILLKGFFNLNRVVTFQSGLLLFPLSYFISKLLIQKKKDFLIKIIYLVLSVIVIIGLFVTLTRSLWISAILSMTVIFIMYMVIIRGIRLKSILFYLILLITPIVWFGLNATFQSSANSTSDQEIEYRAKSIANPTEDSSLLMRVELGFYIYNKFIESPIVGKGLGDYVQYKILSKNKANINYPDNSWIFFLWKGGVIGFLIYLWVLIVLFKQSIFVLKNSDNTKVKILMLSIIGTLAGLILYSQFTAFLIKYKSDVVFSLIIAYTIFEFDKLKRKSESN